MKARTGKLPRKSRKAQKPLPPFDIQLRSSVEEAGGYLRTSRPTVYKLLAEGKLESIKEGRRTFISNRSIAAICVPSA